MILEKKKGLNQIKNNISYEEYKKIQYDKLENIVRENIDINEIYRIMEEF